MVRLAMTAVKAVKVSEREAQSTNTYLVTSHAVQLSPPDARLLAFFFLAHLPTVQHRMTCGARDASTDQQQSKAVINLA